MASEDSTWRSHPFVKGLRYVVRQTFTGFKDAQFVTGEAYVFSGVGYSHQDSSTIFTFTRVGASTPCHWSWHDDEPDSLCGERFAIDEDPDS